MIKPSKKSFKVTPVAIFAITGVIAVTVILANFLISNSVLYSSPLARAAEVQSVLASSSAVLAASVEAAAIKSDAATPFGTINAKTPKVTSIIITPTEPVIYYAPVASSSFSGGSGNNKFGMYVENSADQITAAAELINSNGGDWGYVLLTMNINDRNGGYWQGLFDAAKSAHVIPIVQLFNNGVCSADEMGFSELADTLGGLSWPTRHRYISVFNEVNAGDYWCGHEDGGEYAVVLDKAIKAFKDKSNDFFIMPAALNSSARTGAKSNLGNTYIGEDLFISQMRVAVPDIFSKIDGWATHAYPSQILAGLLLVGETVFLITVGNCRKWADHYLFLSPKPVGFIKKVRKPALNTPKTDCYRRPSPPPATKKRL
ncbi:MAG: hypothetical protein NT141_00140 [candidate division WWE3 bacterium]|nr:hypothetical protein [candidate division WWE3 bacterium]